MPSRSANSRSDRARPAASSSNHARLLRDRLDQRGSHFERSFCIATPGSTSLISIPRRPNATGAVSSSESPGIAWAHPVEGRCSAARQEAVLIGPVERQIEFGMPRRSEFYGLPAVQDRLDQLGAQKGEVDEAPDIATGDAIALGQLPQRSGASGGELLEPRTPARDRLDQRGVTS